MEAAGTGCGAYDQVLLSFQGEIYVFDAVSPEKVQAVLLLLGESQVAATTDYVRPPQSPQATGDFPDRLNRPASRKRIRYSVRQEAARRMQREKGRFTSSKPVSDEAGSSSADWNEGSGQEEKETLCRHCGISSKSTPQMRCGPAGPRSLCNACGLVWAKKGILRDLTEVPSPGAQDQTVKSCEQSDDEPNGSDAMAAAPTIIQDGDNSLGSLTGLSKVPTPGAHNQSVKSGEKSNDEPNGSDTLAAAAISTPYGDNPVVAAERILRRLQSLLMMISAPNFAENFYSHALSGGQNSITSQDLPKNDSVV